MSIQLQKILNNVLGAPDYDADAFTQSLNAFRTGDIVRLNSMIDDQPVIAKVIKVKSKHSADVLPKIFLLESDFAQECAYQVPSDPDYFRLVNLERLGSPISFRVEHASRVDQIQKAYGGSLPDIALAKTVIALNEGKSTSTRESIRDTVASFIEEGNHRVSVFKSL